MNHITSLWVCLAIFCGAAILWIALTIYSFCPRCGAIL